MDLNKTFYYKKKIMESLSLLKNETKFNNSLFN